MSSEQTSQPDHGGEAAPEIDYLPRLAGEPYQVLLRHLHATLRPRTYLEIGTQGGGSLRLAECSSIAIDVAFNLKFPDVIGRKPSCHFYQMSSDAFFQNHDPTTILGGPIDLAFLDGLHLFEFLLRDFSNIEKYCRRNSVVLLHDCLPPAIRTTTRKMNSPDQLAGRYPNFWAGDVWKILPILKQYRSDLQIYCFDAPPTGIVAITNLSPGNTTLVDKYFEIVSNTGVDLDEGAFEEFWRGLELIPTRVAATRHELAPYFWL